LYVAAQQTYVNKDWEYIGGIPGQYDYIQSRLHPNGKLILVGNNSTSGQTDILVTALNIDGSVAWQQTNSGANGQNDYGTDLAIDNTGNIIVCGAVHNGSNVDYRTLKYSSDGSLIWTKQYNGTGNGDDVPVAIRVDANNNIYVTGTSTGNGTLTDYATLKYDQSGNVLWTTRYNYNNLPEVATSLEIDNSGNIFVAGASASSYVNSDFCIVKYNSSGTQISVRRHATTGNGYDLPSEMTIGSNGNIYIVGTSEAGNNKNVKLLALTNTLTVIWAQYIDQFGRDDEGYSIALTPSNNLVITGYSEKTNGGTNLIVAKYSLTGSQLWLKNKTALIDNEIAKGRRVKANNNGKIFVSGECFTGNSRDFITQSYNDNGNLIWERTYDYSNETEKASQLIVSNDDVIITGTTNDGTTDKTASLKYSSFEKNQSFIYDSSGNPVRYENEILVRFKSSVIINTAFDNKDMTYGYLYEFLTPQAVELLTKNVGYNVSKLSCYKVHPKMTSADTVSLTRSGRLIKITPHFATLGIILPSGSNDSVSLSGFKASYNVVDVAEYNNIFYLTANANDPEYTNGNSASLISTITIPDANINIEPAWDITSGMPNIKVGVFDTGINWEHLDFGNGTLSGSKITGGYDYYNSTPISSSSSPDYFGHGTAVAGIIGAIRNNSFGIAGVAGGDYMNSITGISLHDMKISQGNIQECDPATFFINENDIQNAIIEGAVYNPYTGYGFGQHIQNHSWRTNFPALLIKDAFITAYDNEVVMSVASGNGEYSYPCDVVSFPATFKDRMLMKVGANDETGEKAYFSECGYNIDFIAPGVNDLYTSLDKSGSGLVDYFNYGPSCPPVAIDGTSFAAPHAAGVAGLLWSYISNTSGLSCISLYPEDIEYLMQRYATDITSSPATIGYDDETGYGRINAGQTLLGIRFPDYQILHITFTTSASAANLVGLHERTCIENNFMGLGSGSYYVNRYQITASNSHSIPTEYHIIDGWGVGSASNTYEVISSSSINCNGLLNQYYMPDAHNSILSSISNSNATLTGYIYEILDNSFNTIAWYPFDLTGVVEFTYSLYLENNNVGVDEVIRQSSFYYYFYPNPANDIINVYTNKKENCSASIAIYDIYGRTYFFQNKVNIFEDKPYRIDVSSLSNGVYYLNIFNNSESKSTFKVIINR